MTEKMMIDRWLILAKMQDRRFRRAFFENHFFEFCNYYFREYYSFDTPKCLRMIYKALYQWKNVFIKWFRWSAKTTIAQMFVSYCIAYKKKRNIMRYSQTIDNATENLTYIANSFIGDTEWWARFVNDFWNIYYPEYSSRWTSKKIKRIDKFVTENECYIRAMSLWTSPRWKNYTASDGKFRPDLLIFDDVDTIQSCSSRKKIERWFEFLLNEVLWWTTGATQMIFLWNVIYEDWIVPRFEQHIKNDKQRVIINLPIYDENNQIVRDRFVETDAEAEELNAWIKDSNRKYTSLETERRRLWSISFWQNYLLIPYIQGQHIIKRSMIQYDMRCLEYTDYSKIQIWVDPASSEKQWSDLFAMCVAWYRNERRHILETVWLKEEEKDLKNAMEVLKALYVKRNATRVIVETVAFQLIMKKHIARYWMAVKPYKTIKDKVTRVLERQMDFEDHKIVFWPGNEEAINQCLEFPNGEHDDFVDAILLATSDVWTGFFISSI